MLKPVKLLFTNDYMGEMHTENGVVKLGKQPNGLNPYDMMLGALGACFYATFISIVNKKRLTFDSATIDIFGESREELPTTLKMVTINFEIKNGLNEAQFRRSIELATQYCSVHETIKKVAEIKINVKFV
ncbi:MAG: OsmC family protein [Candidatus Izemoplasmatales bacterium]|jgi:putative redox protein|nr:OsmC family protein [Candidatus Izemoplasmatales bacterium]MDD3865049.1 OsmC family protein [Candidatus Izemoplasmatales bacterium]